MNFSKIKKQILSLTDINLKLNYTSTKVRIGHEDELGIFTIMLNKEEILKFPNDFTDKYDYKPGINIHGRTSYYWGDSEYLVHAMQVYLLKSKEIIQTIGYRDSDEDPFGIFIILQVADRRNGKKFLENEKLLLNIGMDIPAIVASAALKIIDDRLRTYKIKEEIIKK